MSVAELDPQFQSYLREPPRLSYTNPDDAWYVRNFVSSLEIMLGRNRIEAVYNRLKGCDFDLSNFFELCLFIPPRCGVATKFPDVSYDQE